MGKENKLTKKERDEIISDAKSSLWGDVFTTIGILILVFCFFYTIFTVLGLNDPNEEKQEMFCNDFKKIQSEVYSDKLTEAFESNEYHIGIYAGDNKVTDIYKQYCVYTHSGKYS